MLPRVVIAAPASGHGKTTLATGLMGAFRREGLEVAGFKVGPDYIDPGYHALATGRPGRNLDPHLCRPEQIVPLLRHGARTPTEADLAVVEGVMGLFDGQIGGEGFASTAHVATLINAPVILVVDISQVSRTAAAIVHGLNTFDPQLRLSGVILNKAGSPRHADEIVAAMEATGLPVLGVLPRDAGIEVPSRHLGLVPAAERAEAARAIECLAEQITAHVSLTEVLQIAYAAPGLDVEPWDPAQVVIPPTERRPVVAVAGGRAFTFCYAETDELLRAAGCRPVIFDPLIDRALPAGTAGLYLGGGFPEVHAVELSANATLRAEIRAAIAAGLPTVAECAGLLYLCRSVDGAPMVGALDAAAAMTDRLTVHYRTPVAGHDHLLAPGGSGGVPPGSSTATTGQRVSGHEFHRTQVVPAHGTLPAWLVDGQPVGFASDTLHAGYLHVHWAGHPQLAQRFADAVHAYAGRSLIDLSHHGDQDIREGLVDLAVNVRIPRPPDWLAAVINDATAQLGGYPRSDEARTAIAETHDLGLDQVLPTAGGAEAFTLLARALQPRRPVVVHPQFTEPEAALLAAGHHPERVILTGADGFRFRSDLIPDDADLVMIGNPTNPTSVLHRRETVAALVRPGRTVVIDEAFMDAVPGEPETMITRTMTGVVVLRSLTKTWGLAGLRAGYAVGDPAVITAMAAQQPPWSVSTPALTAITACLSDKAREIVATAAEEIETQRAFLISELAAIGLPAVGRPAAPFVLIHTNQPDIRLRMHAEGFAVRRGETFPGLGPEWIRVAVRDPASSARFVAALQRVTAERLDHG